MFFSTRIFSRLMVGVIFSLSYVSASMTEDDIGVGSRLASIERIQIAQDTHKKIFKNNREKINSRLKTPLKKTRSSQRRVRRLNVAVKRPMMERNLNIVPKGLCYGEASCFPIDKWAPHCYAGMTRGERKRLKEEYPGFIVSPVKRLKIKTAPVYPPKEFKVTPLRLQHKVQTRSQYDTLKKLLLEAATPETVLSHFRTYLQECLDTGTRPNIMRALETLRECQGHFNVIQQFGDNIFFAQTSMFDLDVRDESGRNTLERLRQGLNPLMKSDSSRPRDRVCNYHHALQDNGPVIALPEWDHTQFSVFYHQFLNDEESRIDRRDFGADCKEFNLCLYNFLTDSASHCPSVARTLTFL